MTFDASTDWTEHVAADEPARFHEYAEEMREIVRRRAIRTGRLGRAVHFKQHVGVMGKLIIGELPEPLQVGPFLQPTIWPVYVRYSSSSIRAMHDALPDVRGVAIKLVGVPGPKLLPGYENALTQDFVFVHLPVLPFATPDDLMVVARAAKDTPLLLLPRVLGSLGLRKTVRMFAGLTRVPWIGSLAAGRFFTAAPQRFGEFAVRFDLLPEPVPVWCYGRGREALREDLVARLDTGPIQYTLRAQFFVHEAKTPIEDASVVWRTPYHELGRLVIPPQDVGSAKGRAIDEYVEKLSFNPWHSIEELRPLGAMMRARVDAYQESSSERASLPEPDGSETFD